MAILYGGFLYSGFAWRFLVRIFHMAVFGRDFW